MGEIYKAHDETLNRPVALKIIRRDLAVHPDRVKRFAQEAKAASALNHPHLIHVYDVGTARPSADDEPIDYIAMEYVEGVTLGDLIHRQNAPLSRLLILLNQVADGLAKAHASGITHRDLKPDNILVSSDGYAKIIDFGLAKLTESESVTPDGKTQARALTADGVILGTAGYMAPEQIEGRRVDHRADIFAFGCILYEAVTRRKAFAGSSSIDSLHKILRGQPEPIESVELAGAQQLIGRCLEKDPERRIQSAKDLSRELGAVGREITAGYDSQTAILPRKELVRSNRLLLGTAVALFAIAAAAALLLFVRKPRTAEPKTVATFPTVEVEKITASGAVAGAAISPDGKYVAYVQREGVQRSLRLRHLTTRSDVEIAPPQNTISNPSFSRDADYVYFTTPTADNIWSLQRVAVLGGLITPVMADVNSAVSHSPDGQRMAFIRGSYVILANLDGTNEDKVVTISEPQRLGTIAPQWTADSRRLAFVTLDPLSVAVLDLRTRTVTKGQPTLEVISALAWSPDHRSFLATGVAKEERTSRLWQIDSTTFTTSKLTTGIDEYFGLSGNGDNTKFVSSVRDLIANLWVTPISDPSQSHAIASGTIAKGSGGLAFLPDGRIAYTSIENRIGELWVANGDGSSARPLLTRDTVEYQWPSGGGHWLAAQSQSGGSKARITLIDLNSGKESTVPGTSPDEAISWPQFSRDGKWLYYGRESKPGVWKVEIPGGTPQQIVARECSSASISPDQNHVACFVDPSEVSGPLAAGGTLAILELPSGRVVHALDPPSLKIPIRWTPDGRAILIAEYRDGASNVWLHPIDGSRSRQITRFMSENMWFFDISPDGKTIVSSRGDRRSDAVLITLKEPQAAGR